MKSSNSFNDFTERDKVLAQWSELIRVNREKEMNRAVRETLKMAASDWCVWIALIAFIITLVCVGFKIWS